MAKVFEVSLFSRWPRGAGRFWMLHFYVRIANLDLAIDQDGVLVTTPRRVFGYIRKAGWHHARIGRAAEGCLS